MLASDLANPEFSNPTDPDARLHVTFFKKPFKNDWKTAQEGRAIFEEVEMIRIVTPGDSTNIIETPVREDHKARFPRHWAYWQNSQGGDLQTGTPLSQWPILNPANVEMLKSSNFRTVEQVASASDDQINKIGMGGGMAPFALRDKAKRFLLVAKDTAAVDKTQQELEAIKAEQARKDAEHAEQIKAMQEQMAQLQLMVSSQLHAKQAEVVIPTTQGSGVEFEPVKRGPGRPRKDVTA